MAGDGKQVSAQFVHIDGNLANCLGCIHMHERAGGMNTISDGADGLEGAHFVVGQHDGDQGYVVADSQRIGIDARSDINRDFRHYPAFFFQLPHRLRHRRVFDGGIQQAACARPSGAEDGQVVSLGGATGEDDFFRFCADQ